MKLFEFLRNLETFYPLNESAEKVENRLSAYVDILEGEIVKSRKKYNFEKILRYIQRNYRYKQFPSLPDLLDFLPYGIVYETTYSGQVGETIKRVIGGHEYEFTIVPNHWDNVKSISQLDSEIAQMKEGVNLWHNHDEF